MRAFYPTWDPETHYIVTVLTLLKKIFYMKVGKAHPPTCSSTYPSTYCIYSPTHPPSFLYTLYRAMNTTLF